MRILCDNIKNIHGFLKTTQVVNKIISLKIKTRLLFPKSNIVVSKIKLSITIAEPSAIKIISAIIKIIKIVSNIINTLHDIIKALHDIIKSLLNITNNYSK